MLTYNDLEKVGQNESDRMEFIQQAIHEHKDSEMYHIAFDAEEYDRQNNITIMKYKKMLYTIQGKQVEDQYSPNHKIPSNFFNRFVTQENQYLLGNGVNLKDSNKKKLGEDFDQKLQRAGRNALVQGESFGLWNYDHLEVFSLTEFVPLIDEENSMLRAGIRFFQQAADKPLRATLYEIDGYTEYIQEHGQTMQVLEDKKAYLQVETKSEADGVESVEYQNYPGFPIIPLWGNPHHQSELVGLRQSIDAYDLIQSGFSNDMDGAHLYWILKNSGGMDDEDIAKAIERLNVIGAAAVEDADDMEPHEIPIPYESRMAYLDKLEQNMYHDFQALNVLDLSASEKTATEIKAAYQPFDNKVDQFEYCVEQFLKGLFEIVGIDDSPSFTRDKVATANEDMQTLLLAAQYLDDEFITKRACEILGDPDAADEILKRKANQDMTRFGFQQKNQQQHEEEEEPEEVENG